ncbi:hypothetical protein [Oleidesulfovibrio sp.]|uniref:hypothetical protein n=1 Tax=Oleidesulfovibrio sp. TaxID=2909707 RepID=UPI003A896CE2
MNSAPQIKPAIYLWIISVAMLAFSGIGQMPIFKRYYLADIPGLGWSADPIATHIVHYVSAGVFLTVCGWLATMFILNYRHHWRLTMSGIIRLAIIIAIIITGYMRVAKNLHSFHWSPIATMLIDWTHLGLAALLGIVAISCRTTGSKAWLEAKAETLN